MEGAFPSPVAETSCRTLQTSRPRLRTAPITTTAVASAGSGRPVSVLGGHASADEARQKADTAANCDAARKNQQALADGIRISNYDKNGERGVMSDQERAEMATKNQKVLAGCK